MKPTVIEWVEGDTPPESRVYFVVQEGRIDMDWWLNGRWPWPCPKVSHWAYVPEIVYEDDEEDEETT